jgi:hypothetical protein
LWARLYAAAVAAVVFDGPSGRGAITNQ